MSLSECKNTEKKPLDEYEASTLKELYIAVDEWPDHNFFYHETAYSNSRLRDAFECVVRLEKETALAASQIMFNTVTEYAKNGICSKESMVAQAKAILEKTNDNDEDRQEALRALFYLTEFLNGRSMRNAVKSVMISKFDDVIEEVNFYLVK